jgi:multiple sugar transport system permease protein
MRSFRRGSELADRLIFAAVLLLALVWVAPIAWVVGLSFKPNEVLMRTTGGIIFPPFTLKNYADILAASSVFGWMANSAIVAAGQTVLTLLVASLAGYGFARTSRSPNRRSSCRCTRCSPNSTCTTPMRR